MNQILQHLRIARIAPNTAFQAPLEILQPVEGRHVEGNRADIQGFAQRDGDVNRPGFAGGCLI